MHRNHPHPKTQAWTRTQSHGKAVTSDVKQTPSTQHIHKTPCTLCPGPQPEQHSSTPRCIRVRHPSQSQTRTSQRKPQTQSHSNEQPGQNPTETSRAHRAHQNLIHNQQRTRPSAKTPEHQAATRQPLPNGSEPRTTARSTKPYPLCRKPNHGDGRDRTDDLLLAKQALSQLSYIPTRKQATPASNPWWAREDSNLRPHAYQACALTN